MNGHHYEVMLQPVKGNLAAQDDVRSNVVAFRPMAHRPRPWPTWPPRAATTAVTVSWTAPADHGPPGALVARGAPARRHRTTVTGAGVRLGPLVAGARYVVAVAALHDATLGPELQATARARGPRPAAPSTLTARRRSDGSVRLRWSMVEDATRYEVSRRVSGSWRRLGWASAGRFDTARWRAASCGCACAPGTSSCAGAPLGSRCRADRSQGRSCLRTLPVAV
ncbi:MAG: fibronectin type III domain-containing protein [Nocardioides sp.]